VAPPLDNDTNPPVVEEAISEPVEAL